MHFTVEQVGRSTKSPQYTHPARTVLPPSPFPNVAPLRAPWGPLLRCCPGHAYAQPQWGWLVKWNFALVPTLKPTLDWNRPLSSGPQRQQINSGAKKQQCILELSTGHRSPSTREAASNHQLPHRAQLRYDMSPYEGFTKE